MERRSDAENTDAGTLDLRVRRCSSRRMPSARRTLRRSGMAAREDLTARCAEKGVVDKKSFIKKYLGEAGQVSPPRRAPRAAKEGGRRVAEALDHLVSSVLGGELDGVPDAKGRREEVGAFRFAHRGGHEAPRAALEQAAARHARARPESLVAMDATTGSSDPYFKLKLKTQKWKSPVAHQTLNPTYDAAAAASFPPRTCWCPVSCSSWSAGTRTSWARTSWARRRCPYVESVVARALRALGAEVFPGRVGSGASVRRRALQVQVPAGGRRGVPRGGGRVRRGRRGRGVRSRGDPRDAAVDTLYRVRYESRGPNARGLFL